MAQWAGQFTGNTHESKVLDREEQLRHAMDVYRSKQTDDERALQAKNIMRLADKLLSARIRAMKARLNAMGPRSPDSPVANSMQARIQQVEIGGIRSILAEFKAADIAIN